MGNGIFKGATILEHKVELHLVTQVKELKGKIYKWVSPGKRGVTDRILFLNKQVWFVELKRPLGERSKLQIKFEKDIRPFTDNYAVVDSIEGVNKLICRIMSKKMI